MINFTYYIVSDRSYDTIDSDKNAMKQRFKGGG